MRGAIGLVALVAILRDGATAAPLSHDDPQHTSNASASHQHLVRRADMIMGTDVSNWQKDFFKVYSWDRHIRDEWGASFAYIKMTEGTTYDSESREVQVEGAKKAGLFRGGYHFALPHKKNPKEQVNFFWNNGGKLGEDATTLPAQLDIEYNPYEDKNGLNTCYGVDQEEMRTFIGEWLCEYYRLSGRRAIIYSTRNWWEAWVRGPKQEKQGDFNEWPFWLAGKTDPPKGWKKALITQYMKHPGKFDLDWNDWHESMQDLENWSRGVGEFKPKVCGGSGQAAAAPPDIGGQGGGDRAPEEASEGTRESSYVPGEAAPLQTYFGFVDVTYSAAGGPQVFGLPPMASIAATAASLVAVVGAAMFLLRLLKSRLWPLLAGGGKKKKRRAPAGSRRPATRPAFGGAAFA